MTAGKVKYVILFFALTYSSFCQIGNLSFTAGITTTEILGKNPNNSLIVSPSAEETSIGGSFDGPQIGLTAKALLNLDQHNRFVIPIGFEYSFFDARERIPAPGHYTSKWKHRIDIVTPTIGFNYSFIKFPLANVRGYIGVEARYNIIGQGEWTQTVIDIDNDSTTSATKKTKNGTSRVGGAITLGFVGDIESPFFINFSCSLGVMNLLGRDNKRGELLTPTAYFETKESIIYTFHVSLLIQYKL